MDGGLRDPVLGISGDFHDAAAALVVDGRVVAAAEEERFTRQKHDPSLPRHALAWCLEEAGIVPGFLGTVAFYEKPLTAYERVLATAARVGVRAHRTLPATIATWSRSKLWVPLRIERELRRAGHPMPRLVFAEHHQSHAAAAFYPSPFESAAILTIDGVGEWATATIGWGRGNRIEVLRQMDFPDSVGLLYSAITALCGFDVNDGESKLMGLAPYGQPAYLDVLRQQVVDVEGDGSIRIDQRWFTYRSGRTMCHPRLYDLLGGPPLAPGQPLGQREADLARSIQELVEDVVLKMAAHAQALTGERRVVLAGGVALNCVANDRLRRDGPFDDVWVQPAAGDGGSALGAALWAWHQLDDHPREVVLPDAMSGAFLGPSYAADEVADWLTEEGVAFTRPAPDALDREVAEALAGGSIVGWFCGRMEFGPRALGHRSILADPRNPAMTARLNQAVKRREGFRPFAPAVLAEEADAWFDLDRPSPYMLFTSRVQPARRRSGDAAAGASFAEQLAADRSEIAAATHIDQSARVQTVDAGRNPDLHRLLRAFQDVTGCPVLLNTSFNGRDEPIVRTPADALRCFRATDLDLLVLEGCVIRRPATAEVAA